ncbi:MAG: 23S rRNA (adenine(2503)-C(2))-methyltransferase RlmN [Armatimonadota bacterium]|nr:23S rRNA (adenine(2503)-C(2))-methyltransferase RlmN [Armatimonadota bacterium]
MVERKPIDVFGMTTSELASLCDELGEPRYRAEQLADWLYRKGVRDFSAMTNLPKTLRERLKECAALTRAEVVAKHAADDGTTKFLLKLSDGETVESVLLPYPDRVSVCVSTQVGCPVGCVFCATGASGFVRNLTAGEIVDQVLTLSEASRATHVVFMGMGEPLLNFENVLKAVRLLHDEVGISMRRMTVSTVGITPAIRRMADLKLQLTLAVSLHAPDQDLRAQLIPLSAKYPLDELLQVCRSYANYTKRRITFEYLLLAGINDSPSHAARLAKILKGTLCHVNLIPFNEVPEADFKRPSERVIAAFRAVLERSGVQVTQRVERGHAVAAACGQLRRRSAGGALS